MKRPAPPPFVAPQNYRRRRLMDLARLLPVFGLAGFVLPLLGRIERTTSGAGLWLFSVWALLVVGAVAIGLGLRHAVAGDDAAGSEDGRP